MKTIPVLLCLVAATFAAKTAAPLPEVPILYDTDGDKIAQNLNQLMLTASGAMPVIVMLNQAADAAVISGLQARVGGFETTARWDIIPGFAANLTAQQIVALSLLGNVKQIEYDNEVRACLTTAETWYGITQARTDFGVDGDRSGGANVYNKDDIVIGIIDTGTDPGHMDLDGGKIIGWVDYVNGRTSPYDDHGHGTHCASIAAGSGDAGTKGVAPGAALVGVKVLNSAGSGTSTAIINGINWCVTNKTTYGIEIISLSLGSSGSSNGQDAISVACNNAVAAGLVVSVAAGNAGPRTYTVGSPGAAENVVTVGAMSDCGEKGYFLAYFSSRGPTADNRMKPDVCGPGWNISAAKKGTTNQYTVMSGTSMATPFIAGTAALMLDANPGLTPAQVKSYLQSTAQDWGPTGKDNDYGYGRSQGYDAIKLAGGYTGTGPTIPQHVYKSEALGGKGKIDIWTINVNSTAYPIAATMVMPSWSTSIDFDLYLYNPSNALVASATSSTREEYIGYTPTVTGNYKLYVKSYKGSGSYWFDLSCANASSIVLSQNQYSVPPGDEGVMADNVAPLSGVKVARQAAGGLAFTYDLAAAGSVTLAIYDGTGRRVTTATLAGKPGRNYAELSTAGIAGGIYFYHLTASGSACTGKIALIK
jgi:serine protease AprX